MASPDDGSGGGVYDEPGNTPDTDAPLRQQEKKAASGGGWKTNVGGSQPQSRISGLLSGGKKKGIIAGAAGAVVVGFIGLAIHLLGSSLLLPHVKSIISERRLASSARHLNDRTTVLTADEVYAGAESEAGSEMKSILGKSAFAKTFYALDPQAAVREFKSSGAISFVKDSKGRISQVLVDGESIDVPDHQFGKYFSNRSASKQFYKDFYQKVDQALLRDGQGELVRSRVGKAILSEYGGKLFFWTRAQIQAGNNESAATAANEAEATQLELFDRTVGGTPAGGAITGGAEKASQKAQADVRQCISNGKCNVNSDQLSLLEDSGAAADIKSYAKSLTSLVAGHSVLKFLGNGLGLYSIAVPMCLIYDTSITVASSIIKASETGAIQAWLSLSSAADQQKAGVVTATLVGGFNKFLKWFSDSIPNKYSNGLPFDTLGSPFTQASAGQGYNPFWNIPALTKMLKGICGQITSTTVELAMAAVAVAAILPGAGTLAGVILDGFKAISAKIGEEGVSVLIQDLVKQMGARIFENGVSKKLRSSVTSDAFKSLLKNGAFTTASLGIPYLAQMLVASESKAFSDGADPHEFVDLADKGAVLDNAGLEQGNYGRPMTASETSQSDKANVAYINQTQSGQSNFQRYFALSNPTSSLSDGVITANNYIEHPKQLALAVLKAPIALMSSAKNFFGSLFSHNVLAASTPTVDTQDYNTVQWGWSPQEDSILQNDPTYDPLVNAAIVESSHRITTPDKMGVQDIYGPCYSSPTSDLLTGVKPKIKLDSSTGALKDDSKVGDCTPTNLGYGDTGFDGDCSSAAFSKLLSQGIIKPSDCSHMVFRWRVYNSYLNAAQNMADIQNAGSATGG